MSVQTTDIRMWKNLQEQLQLNVKGMAPPHHDFAHCELFKSVVEQSGRLIPAVMFRWTCAEVLCDAFESST